MSVTPTKPVGNGPTVNTTSPSMPNPATVNDDIIPVLIAANPGLILNYKQMTTLDPQHRTISSWEHKFRKWRARAKEIGGGTADVNGGESSKDAGGVRIPAVLPDDGEAEPIKKKRATKTKPKLGTDMVAEKQATPNATTEDGANDNQNLPLRPTTARKGPAKDPSLGEGSSAKNGDDVNHDDEDTTAKANTGKKRDETTQDDINESPRKKARAEKKGTARVVKKKATKPTEEVISEEESDSEKTVKAKGKGRKAAGGAKSAAKGKAKMDEASGQDEGQMAVVV